MEYSGLTGSRRQPLVIRDRNQAQILATRREKRAGMLADLRRRHASARYAIERLSAHYAINEGGRNLNVNIRKLHPDAVIPQYATAGAAAFDLVSVEDVVISPGETKKIPLGLAFEIPEGYEMQIRPRSGITLNTKLRVQLGTVDSDYRDGVSAIVDNIELPDYSGADENGLYVCLGHKPLGIDNNEVGSTYDFEGGTYIIRKGDRICQGVIQAVPAVTFTEVDELSETERGAGGFGSTGTV
jgi:dUTP pyrophosphatase